MFNKSTVSKNKGFKPSKERLICDRQMIDAIRELIGLQPLYAANPKSANPFATPILDGNRQTGKGSST